MFKLGFWLLRLLLVLLAVAAALVWWQRGQLAVLALTRTDPLPEVEALVARQRYAEAAELLDFFLQYDYVRTRPEAQQLHEAIETRRSSLSYQAGKIAEGVLHGRSDENIGQIAGIASDFLVIGDLRDLGIQAWRYARDEETDPVLIALSSLGLAASAAQLGSAWGSAATAGAGAPALAASTSAKSTITTLKTLRHLGRLPAWLSETLVQSARQLRRQRNTDGLAPLQAIFADVATLQATPSGLRLLAATRDATDLRSAARFAKIHGRHSGTLQRIGGTALVGNVQLSERLGRDAVELAATYGQRGLRVLGQTGALRFAKYSARAAKIGWKGDIWRLLAGWLARLPGALLLALMAAGLLALWPRRRMRRVRAPVR
ncbi:hypothetical protein D8I35_12680 [Corticibacter populi]|uniref:Uncharacterized protein n=1 Tax=Corticibacter populi TaxID=1550736 RepID=A0A3M6QSH3_9BURK|nr:hypothetical protein [Corticibacter populi]RMX05986.1 hypothetical protein D8I35_12680 [Corticibacter populi]RZS30683.1 hypothetical protein EV687_2870 [Corticibacter populi]